MLIIILIIINISKLKIVDINPKYKKTIINVINKYIESLVALILSAINPAKIISREMVINNLDLNQGKKDLNERNVDVQITRLRKKIEVDPTNPRHLKTIRGKGYQFLS